MNRIEWSVSLYDGIRATLRCGEIITVKISKRVDRRRGEETWCTAALYIDASTGPCYGQDLASREQKTLDQAVHIMRYLDERYPPETSVEPFRTWCDLTGLYGDKD